jgi:DNA-binding ferritin-like protein
MNIDTEEQILKELQSLLQEQIELVQHGSSTGERIKMLSTQADSIVQKIVQAGIHKRPEFENQWKQLHELYDSLYLSMTCQKAEVSDKLNQVRRGRKTVGTYRSNINFK